MLLNWKPPLVVSADDAHGSMREALAADGDKLSVAITSGGGMVLVQCLTRLATLPEIASALNALDLPPSMPQQWAIMFQAGNTEAESTADPGEGKAYVVALRPIAGAVPMKNRAGPPVLQ